MTGGVGASVAGSPSDVRAEVADLLGVSVDDVDPGGNLISQGLDLNPARPEVAYYTRAIANEALGRTRAAYDDYRQAAALKPEWSEPKNQLKRFSVVGKPG